jgi:hypothetical protein
LHEKAGFFKLHFFTKMDTYVIKKIAAEFAAISIIL